MNKCEQWLKELLEKHEFMLVQDVHARGKEQGFKKSEVKAAKKSLGVQTIHQFDKEGELPNWFWVLPGSDTNFLKVRL